MTKIERNKRARFNFWACSSILDLPASQSWQRNQWTLYDIWKFGKKRCIYKLCRYHDDARQVAINNIIIIIILINKNSLLHFFLFYKHNYQSSCIIIIIILIIITIFIIISIIIIIPIIINMSSSSAWYFCAITQLRSLAWSQTFIPCT